MVAFIDDHKAEYGVEPICRVLPIAPSTYYWHKAREADPSLRSARAQRDELLRPLVRRVWDQNFQVYGAEQVWTQLNREGIRVARCTVARLMTELGLRGVVRGRSFTVTTHAADGTERPLDLVDRDFTASRPNELWVSDLTYVRTGRTFAYVAFIIDAFARRIVGWQISSSLRSDLALDALEQAISERLGDEGERPVHHAEQRPPISVPDDHGRIQSRVPGDSHRAFDSGRRGHRGDGVPQRVQRVARSDHHGQRLRVPQPCVRFMGLRSRREARFYSTGQARPERLHRELQRNTPGRVLEPALVPLDPRRETFDRAMES